MTAATESQFGHVEVKLGRPREAVPHLTRAATFYLQAAQQAHSSEKEYFEQQQQLLDGKEGGGGWESTSRRRIWLAQKAHSLWMHAGKIHETELKDARRACVAYEKALASVGAMHDHSIGQGGKVGPDGKRSGGGGGEASADALKLLLHSLRAFGSALELAGNWRKAANVYGQLRTLSTRLLGKQHKATRAATQRARRAQDRVNMGVPSSANAAAAANAMGTAAAAMGGAAAMAGGASVSSTGGHDASFRAAGASSPGEGGRSPLAPSSTNHQNQQKSPEQLTGDESWLN